MKKTTMPDWCVAVKKAMIDHDDMTVTELAKETGFSRSHISQVVNGVLVPSENVQGAVPEHQRGGVPELTYISSIPERTA